MSAATTTTPRKKLTTPQLRLLRALIRKDVEALSRSQLAARAGFTAISGTVTRSLNGASRLGIVGLVESGAVKKFKDDQDGHVDTVYSVTAAGKRAYAKEMRERKTIGKPRERAISINKRYRKARKEALAERNGE